MTGQAEILKLVGAIVLATQSAEHSLKTILPFTDDKDPSLTAALARAEELRGKTLGHLIRRLVDAATPRSETFEADLKRLVDDRNRVVHHFAETYGAQLKNGDVESVLTSLRLIQANASAFEQSVQRLTLHAIEGLRDATFRGTPEFDEFEALCAELRRGSLLQAAI